MTSPGLFKEYIWLIEMINRYDKISLAGCVQIDHSIMIPVKMRPDCMPKRLAEKKSWCCV